MTARFLQKLLTADGMGLILFVLSLQVLTYGVSASLPDTDTRYFFWICLVAAFISFILGKYRWNGIQASTGIAALGVLFVWVLGARLTQPLLDLVAAVLSILPQIFPAIRYGTPLDTSAITTSWTDIVQASFALLTRIQTLIPGLDGKVTTNDALISGMIWVLILWLTAAWMGWFAEKRNATKSLSPAILLLAAVTSYSQHQIDSLWLMVLLMLLLMSVWNYRKHILQWNKYGIDYSDSVRTDNLLAVMSLTLAIGAAAIITPSFSVQDIVDNLRSKGTNETAEILGIQKPPASEHASSTQIPSLPREHLLSGGSANSEEIVMTVRTGELPPLVNESLPIDAPRYYWRSTIYDQYAGTGWVTSRVSMQKVSADTPIIPGLLNGYRVLHLDVQMARSEGRLFWNGILFSTDIPFTANWRVQPPSGLFADRSALIQADILAASSTATSYKAETYVPIFTIQDLRAASTEYSEEIRERYISLPESVPQRVHDLAHVITNGKSNPYDKAWAIESYLRANYPYDLEVPPPPEGGDVADFFLFDLQKGYCDYYATAMVVLARSAGIPARFVSGYSPGSYDASNAQYVVRALDAHSWVEVYFPDIGWIEFEPTASLPEIEYAEGSLPVPDDQHNKERVSALLAFFRLEKILIWVLPAIGFFVLIIIYFILIDPWLYLRLAPETAIDRIYQNFYRAGRPLAGVWTYSETSSEYLQKLLGKLNEIGKFARFVKILESLKKNAAALTDLYHLSLFTDYQVNKRDARITWQTWNKVRRQLLMIRLMLFVTGNGVDTNKSYEHRES